MDALCFRVSSSRQITENQFQDLLEVAEKDASGRDWNHIRHLLSQVLHQEQTGDSPERGHNLRGARRELVEELATQGIHVEQGMSGRTGARRRPVLDRMKHDAAQGRFDRLLVWRVSWLGKDLREVLTTVYQLVELGVTVLPVKSRAGPVTSIMGRLLGEIQTWFSEMENSQRSDSIRAGQALARAGGPADWPTKSSFPAGPGHGTSRSRPELAPHRTPLRRGSGSRSSCLPVGHGSTAEVTVDVADFGCAANTGEGESTFMDETAQLQIAELTRMGTEELRRRYHEVFCEEPRTAHKQHLVRRIAWRLQALSEGEVSERARRRALEIATDADVQTKLLSQLPPLGRTRGEARRTGRDVRLPVGTLLSRAYHGRTVVAKVLGEGFEYEGQRYGSLSAVARPATGTRCNGRVFFGLAQRGEDAQYEKGQGRAAR
jgi:DNA invertase Pin-like site-specific DNA recombinase